MSEFEPGKTELVRAGLERACKDFTVKVENLGFKRTKKMYWTRQRPFTTDFVTFFRHGSTYGPPISFSVDIRVHFGIRVLNDTFEALALNGPTSDQFWLRNGNYHLRFNSRSWSTYDRCIDDLLRIVVERGEPWFRRFHSTDTLLHASDSPLRDSEKENLLKAIGGKAESEHESCSLKLLGIKSKK
jgi:hypothetical protein